MAPHLPPLEGAVCSFLPCPPFVAGASPPSGTSSVGVVGQPRAPGAVCCRRASLAGGGGEGRPVSRPPVGLAGGPGGREVASPQPVSLPSLGGQESGRHRRRPGHGGRGPPTAPVCRRVLPPGVVRVSLFCAGVGSPACRDPRGSGRRGVRGRAACGSSCAPLRALRSLLREEGQALCLGGAEGQAPPRPASRGGSGGGEGGGATLLPAPPVLGGRSMASVLVPLGAPPGYIRSAGDAGQPWALGAAMLAAGG